MSERTLWMMALMTAACLALAPAAPLGAQSRAQAHEATEAALLRHLDSILPVYRDAVRAADAERSRRRAEAQALAAARPHLSLDTITVGPLRIATFPDQAERARELFADVWSEYQPAVDDSPRLARALFTFQWADRLRPGLMSVQVESVQMRGWDSRGAVENRIRDVLGMALGVDLQSTRTGTGWLRSPIVRPPPDPADVYRGLAATPSKINRSCLHGDVHACEEALGLGVKTGSWKSWYTPREERDLALKLGYNGSDRHKQALRDACRTGEQSACDRLVNEQYTVTLQSGLFPGTLPLDARQSLLWIALERGGAGAWARLLKTGPQAPPERALAAASGLDQDRLVAAWRSWVLAQRPDMTAGFSGGMLLAAFWILLFAALATRSTRWRLG